MTDRWPEIPYEPWSETSEALHQWLQIVGKYRLAHTPWLNHSWHATLYLNARGLDTSIIHCGDKSVQVAFDFIDHQLVCEASDGKRVTLALGPMSVAAFYDRFRGAVDELGVAIDFDRAPNEVPDPIPFPENTETRAYDGDAVQRFWRAMVEVDRVFKQFRTALELVINLKGIRFHLPADISHDLLDGQNLRSCSIASMVVRDQLYQATLCHQASSPAVFSISCSVRSIRVVQ
jgi:hypothetical protein